MNPVIKIVAIDKLPSKDKLGWNYPMDELDYLIDQIKDGDRRNNSTMLLYDKRLYELKDDIFKYKEIKIDL